MWIGAAVRCGVQGDDSVRFAFWKFVHNGLIHPWLALPVEPKWAQRAHDWTAERCWGAG